MTKISAYTALTSPASSDVLPVVDVSDTSMAASGTTKKITIADLSPVNWLNVVTMFGADPSGVADSTTAIQNAINAQSGPVYFPPGNYLVCTGGVSITLLTGTTLLGSGAGSYSVSDAIPGISYLHRAASSNVDVFVAPDGNNYFTICDLAIDGNKNNNTSGKGLNVQDGSAGQECQALIHRCFFHDNPDSNVYLGNNRRGSKVQFSVFHQSGAGDGITVCGSDNLLMSNICGSNARAGINLGSTISQNWASFGSNLNSTVTHVFNNDVYGNQVGIAVPSNAGQSMIIGNGIDRNTRQGVTVYNTDTNVIIGNAFHSNGQAADNTYAHIDLASGVSGVLIADNMFGPVDGGITNLCTTCVNIASWSNTGVISGNIGRADASSPDTHSGLINSQSNTPPATRLSDAGALIQGSGNDILTLRNSGGTTVTKITQGGSFVHTGGGAQYTAAQNVMGSASALASTILSLVGTATGVAQLKTQLFSGQTADIATFLASDGTTVLGKITKAGVFVGPQAASVSYKPANPTATASGSLVCMGIGSTCALTPGATGKVMVTVNGTWLTATAAAGGSLSARYGTGTAPVNGAADTGTRWGTGSADATIKAGSATAGIPFSFTELLSLTAGTAYWFDLVTSTTVGADVATIANVVMTLTELPA